MKVELTNLFFVSLIAFGVPFVIGFVPRLRVPAVVLEIIAGIFVGHLLRGDPSEELYRKRLDAMGFGFFVPAFFISSGLTFQLEGVLSGEELMRIALFVTILMVARGLPALLYRRYLSVREVTAAGLLQATNLSFIVVAVSVGTGVGRMRPVTGSSLIVAGLLSAVMLPAIAQGLLGNSVKASPSESNADSDEAEVERRSDRLERGQKARLGS